MNINNYIDDVVTFLFQNGIYDRNNESEVRRISEKVRKLKIIASTDNEYSNKTFEEKKQIIDAMLNDILTKNVALKENYDPIRKEYAKSKGEIEFGKTLLEKQSITTEENLEVSYCTIGKGSIHLHCGISRKIDYIDSDGKKITHYHNLLRKLKKYISEEYNLTLKEDIERMCFEQIIRPYVLETLQSAVNLCKKYGNLKNIRLDTNDGFFKQIYPVLKECGFEIIDENDKFHMDKLQIEFPQYKFPEQLKDFYCEYPDRKNSVTIHVSDLEKNLNNMNSLSKEDIQSHKAI